MKPRTETIGSCTLYLGTMEETIGGIERADHILTDPPYLYIKTHDFDKEFNEQLFFESAKRLLPDDGFIALFGRGTSFYRWNTRLTDLGPRTVPGTFLGGDCRPVCATDKTELSALPDPRERLQLFPHVD
jgi:hypothetical protein